MRTPRSLQGRLLALLLAFDEGRLVLRSSNAPATPMLDADARIESGFATVRMAGEDWRVFVARGAERDVRVYVGEALASRAAILLAVLRSALWPMAVALPLLALAAWGAVHRGVAPLRRLGRALSTRQPRDLHPVTVIDAPSEIGSTIDALNGLFGRIAVLLESERRFTADAAYELRTPIAAIRAQAQVALAETDDGARRDALRKTLEGCDRASHLVDQLLTLSRLEALDAPMVEPVDVSAVARLVVADLAPVALAKRQALELEAGEHCCVRGSDVLLTVLIRNLVDNAVRYSPPGGRIIPRVHRKDGRVVLSVGQRAGARGGRTAQARTAILPAHRHGRERERARLVDSSARRGGARLRRARRALNDTRRPGRSRGGPGGIGRHERR